MGWIGQPGKKNDPAPFMQHTKKLGWGGVEIRPIWCAACRRQGISLYSAGWRVFGLYIKRREKNKTGVDLANANGLRLADPWIGDEDAVRTGSTNPIHSWRGKTLNDKIEYNRNHWLRTEELKALKIEMF